MCLKARKKNKHAVQSGSDVTIRLSHADLNGDHVLAVTKAQINKMKKAYENGKGMTIKMSKTQLQHNRTVQGGFLQFLLSLLATAGRFLATSVLPALTGALSGLGSAAGSKIVDKFTGKGMTSGNGAVYLKKVNSGVR